MVCWVLEWLALGQGDRVNLRRLLGALLALVGSGCDPPPPASVHDLLSAAPGTGTVVSLPGVVVVARLATSSFGELWVQDQGGGPRSGILVYCDYGGATPTCASSRPVYAGFRQGHVVDVVGTFERRRPSGASDQFVQYRLINPVITPVGATVAVVATPATAEQVAAEQFPVNPFKGAYVEVAGPLAVADVAPAEFEADCGVGSSTLRYTGFLASGPGGATVAVGLNLYQTVNACIPDKCPGGGRSCSAPVALGQTWSVIRGVVEPHYEERSGRTFLRLSPTDDGDLAP